MKDFGILCPFWWIYFICIHNKNNNNNNNNNNDNKYIYIYKPKALMSFSNREKYKNCFQKLGRDAYK